jgi:hypothetical protein
MKTANAYSSKELSPTAWPDFEALFAKHNGVWGGCWCMFYRTKGEFLIKGHGPDNKKAKKALVKKRRTHGIIVYSGEAPLAGSSMVRNQNFQDWTLARRTRNSVSTTKESDSGE